MAGRKNPAGEKQQKRPARNKETAQSKLYSAIQAGKQRDYRKALALLEELLSGFDAPAEAYLYLGRTLHALKNYPKALAGFNDFIRLKPDSPQGYFFAGRCCLALEMPHKAVPLLRKARSLNPQNIIIKAMLGAAYLKSRHSQLALDVFQEAVESAAEKQLPHTAQARLYRAYLNAIFIRGINLCRMNNYELGSQMLDFVLGNAGGSPLLRLELGRACRELGRLPEALEHYTRALAFNPNDLRIRWHRASILMSLGNQKEALEEIEEIRSLDSGLPDLPWNSQSVNLYMIHSFLENGEWRRSADCCRLWIRQNGPEALIHAMYAEAQRNLKKFDLALNHLERAVEIDPKNIQLWYERVLVAWDGQNWKALEKALRTVKKLGGEDDIYKRFSVLLAAKTSSDEKEAIGLLQKAIRAMGPEPELMYALGENYLKIGLADLALSWFKKTTGVMGNHERAWLGRIAALQALSSEKDIGEKRGLAQGLSKPERQGQMRIEEKFAAELRESFDQYVKRWPDNFTIRRERALYLVNTFEYEKAFKELETLLAWEPSNFSLRRVLAYAYRKTGRYREAAVFLKSLLKEKPRDIGILLEYSGCLERSGAVRYAMQILEKAGEYMSRNLDIPLALSLLYFKERNVEKAFDILREAAALHKNDPRPYRYMAMLATKEGDKDGAKRYERQASKIPV
ncbi:MAG: tetratricopeptide repeat protein [Treponema sp.]|nr:tetratricopeptide repeat protein [Treponema sp.]